MTINVTNQLQSTPSISGLNYFQFQSTPQQSIGLNIVSTNATAQNFGSIFVTGPSQGLQGNISVMMPARDLLEVENGELVIPERALRLKLPDGAVLHVEADGKYRLEDSTAVVTYRANRMREFNPYVNASDLLARFIAYTGQLGLRQREPLQLPLELFVHWLIIEAATKDEDAAPTDVVPVAQHPALAARRRPRCLFCRRFVTRRCAEAGFAFCHAPHAARYAARLEQKEAA